MYLSFTWKSKLSIFSLILLAMLFLLLMPSTPLNTKLDDLLEGDISFSRFFAMISKITNALDKGGNTGNLILLSSKRKN